MPYMSIRGVSLFVKVVGRGYPLLLMHGGPGADYITLLSFKRLADRFTLVYYDHRCNGRSIGIPVSTMTWENLTADADALREALGFDRWAVLGHSFGGNVALEYALRYPQNLSHLLLMDTGGDIRWARENAQQLLARRGFGPDIVETCRRYFSGEIAPNEMFPMLMKLGEAYNPHFSGWKQLRMLPTGLRSKLRPEAFIWFGQTVRHWTVMDRLGEITVPTLVFAGREDFLYPPEHQEELAAGIPNARLELIDGAGHNPHWQQTAHVMRVVKDFMADVAPGRA